MSRAERAAMAKEEEKRLHQLECTRLDTQRTPQTALDYEELLQSSPNSSAIWIKFISFHLEVSGAPSRITFFLHLVLSQYDAITVHWIYIILHCLTGKLCTSFFLTFL